MKKLLLTIFAINYSLASALCATVGLVHEGYWVLDSKKELLVEVKLHPELTIDHVTSEGFEIYGPPGTEKFLQGKGAVYYSLQVEKDLLSEYPSSAQITAQLQSIAKDYPQYMVLTSIGKSHQGKDLWMLKISDNVSIDEQEPESKYIANMHGNEIVGRELMMLLLKDIASGIQRQDTRIMNLINNSEIFIMPSMNPDGADQAARGNGRNIDLNRNFPDFTTRDNRNEPGTREPETRAIMAWQGQRHIALSANFHGGAVVVNYPWDTTPDAHPHEEYIIDTAKDYADLVPEMRNSREFDGGIVNGYAWYEVNGGMQDWSYYWYGDLQFTMEVSGPKWPNYNDVPKYYQDNKESLLQFLEKAQSGFGLHSTQPLSNVPVTITSKSRNWSLKRQYFGREFFAVLPPDSYDITVELPNQMVKFQADVAVNRSGSYFKLPL